MLKELAKNHKLYLSWAKTLDRNYAEDLVQDTYIRLYESGKKFEEINGGYVYFTMRSIFLNNLKKNKEILLEDFELMNVPQEIEEEVKKIELDFSVLKPFEKLLIHCVNGYETFNDNDQEVYHVKGSSIAKLSREVNIPYVTLYSSFKNIKDKLRKQIVIDEN